VVRRLRTLALWHHYLILAKHTFWNPFGQELTNRVVTGVGFFRRELEFHSLRTKDRAGDLVARPLAIVATVEVDFLGIAVLDAVLALRAAEFFGALARVQGQTFAAI
jgi:hypothetical protein